MGLSSLKYGQTSQIPVKTILKLTFAIFVDPNCSCWESPASDLSPNWSVPSQAFMSDNLNLARQCLKAHFKWKSAIPSHS